MPDSDMMHAAIFICDSASLHNGGKGVRFPVTAAGKDASGFVVRYEDIPYAYLNRCAHMELELDWKEGEFFESSGAYLMCATHGALYDPRSGRCAGGPCRGKGLRPIAVLEHDGKVYWLPDDIVRPVLA